MKLQMQMIKHYFPRLPIAIFVGRGGIFKRSGVPAMLALATGLCGYLLPFELSADEPSSFPPAQSLSISEPYISRLALAQRKGRCRALNYQLSLLQDAGDEKETELALKHLSMLTGEMMNAYPMQGADDPDSRALPEIYTAEGRRDLLQAREALRDTLRAVRGSDARQAAAQVSEQCRGCHARFMRDGGADVTLSFQGLP
jgi:hypothetical protein